MHLSLSLYIYIYIYIYIIVAKVKLRRSAFVKLASSKFSLSYMGLPQTKELVIVFCDPAFSVLQILSVRIKPFEPLGSALKRITSLHWCASFL